MKDKKNRKKNRNKTNGTSAYTEKMNQQPNGSKDSNAVLSKEVAGEKNEDNNVKTVSLENGKSEDVGIVVQIPVGCSLTACLLVPTPLLLHTLWLLPSRRLAMWTS